MKKVICQTPQEYGYDTATWTGALVIDFVEKRYSVKYKKTHIYTILRTLGFGFQKGKICFPESEDREKEVEAIKKNQSIDENTVTVFEDEAFISNTATVSYGWSKRGYQPKICQSQ